MGVVRSSPTAAPRNKQWCVAAHDRSAATATTTQIEIVGAGANAKPASADDNEQCLAWRRGDDCFSVSATSAKDVDAITAACAQKSKQKMSRK